MGRPKQRRPSFFKVLIGDFATKLRIPPAFVKNCREKLPEISILKTETGGTWVIPIEQIGSCQELFFTHNGWYKFVEDQELEVGDLLVFRLISDSTFEVVAYDRTCCEKKLNSSIDCSIGDEPTIREYDEENPYMYGPKTRSQKRNQSQDDLYVKRSSAVNVKVESNRSEEDVEPSLDEHNNENPFMDGRAKYRKRNESRTNSSYAKRSRTANVKMGSDQSEFGSVLKRKYPYFSSVVRHSHKYVMPIRRAFAIETGLIAKKSTVLRNGEGKVWPVDIRIRGDAAVYLCSGWSDFRRANKIANGVTCLFKFIPSDGNVIHVQNLHKGKGKRPHH